MAHQPHQKGEVLMTTVKVQGEIGLDVDICADCLPNFCKAVGISVKTSAEVLG